MSEHEALIETAMQASANGDPRAAQALLKQVLKQDPTHIEAWQLLYRQSETDKPFADFQKDFTAAHLGAQTQAPVKLETRIFVATLGLVGGLIILFGRDLVGQVNGMLSPLVFTTQISTGNGQRRLLSQRGGASLR